MYRNATTSFQIRTSTSGVLGGEVLFNGQGRGGAFWRESAYVKQDDVHIPVLTVQVRRRINRRVNYLVD